MSSIRHLASVGPSPSSGAAGGADAATSEGWLPRGNHEERDESTTVVLAAARAAILAVGVRRTTLTDVARRAGVSRMTVYRRFPDATALVAELLTRELAEVLHNASAVAADRPTGRARLVEAVVTGAVELERHPVWRKVLDVDPEMVLPYVTDRLGGTQLLALEALRGMVADGQADGSIRTGDPRRLAVSLLLVVQSFVLAAVPVAELLPASDRLEELRHVLDASLRPVPPPGTAAGATSQEGTP